MRHFVLIILATFFIFKVIGQRSLKANTVYVELGGNALFTSINYERQILKQRHLNFHVGTGMYGIQPAYWTIPFGVNYLFKLGNPTSFIDLGFGATYTKADVKLYAIVDRKDPAYINTNYWNYIPCIGYRKQAKSNLMYRFSLTPVINHNDLLPFVGFAIGKSFD
jgi:hypothetical protein